MLSNGQVSKYVWCIFEENNHTTIRRPSVPKLLLNIQNNFSIGATQFAFLPAKSTINHLCEKFTVSCNLGNSKRLKKLRPRYSNEKYRDCTGYLCKNVAANDGDFWRQTIISHEAHFSLNGAVNKQNCHQYASENPQFMHEEPLYDRGVTFLLSLWLRRTSSRTSDRSQLLSTVSLIELW